MSEIIEIWPENDYRSYLEHHGILGMKWGVRRYQNRDGSLTNAGKKHYAKSLAKNKSGSIYDRAKAHKKDFVEKMSDDEVRKLAKLNKDYDRKLDELSNKHTEAFEKIWDSNEIRSKAYKSTYDHLKRRDPEYLNSIIKLNGGSKKKSGYVS